MAWSVGMSDMPYTLDHDPCHIAGPERVIRIDG